LILFPYERIFYLPKKVTVKEYLFTFQVSQDMGIEIPIPISVRLRDLNNIFPRIVHTAQQPHLSIPETEAGKTRRQYRQLLNSSLMVVSGEPRSYLAEEIAIGTI
jgi:hypothetical protein